MIARRAAPSNLRGGLVLSGLAHGALLVGLLVARPEPQPVLPPIYRVTMVAAPPGPRQAGVVRRPAPTPPEPPAPVPTPTPPTPAPTPPTPAPRAAETPPKAMPLPDAPKATRQQQVATPNPAPATATPTRPRAAPPTAGGGPEGGRGTDVANVDIRGIEFPFPAYLTNIVRQIILRFTPPDGRPLVAEVKFLIHRDGSVTGIEMVRRSGDYEFDTEARAAVEAAGRDRAFNELPSGFSDDVLPVFFSFDPRIIR